MTEAETGALAAAATPRSRRRWHVRNWPMRTQLLVGFLVLLTLFAAIVGTVAVVGVRQLMMNQLDSQLLETAERSKLKFVPLLPDQLPGKLGQFGPMADNQQRAAILEIPGQSPGTIGALVSAGETQVVGYLQPNGTSVALSAAALPSTALQQASAQPQSADLGPDLGTYRIAAVSVTSQTQLVIGLPMRGVDRTTAGMTWLVVGVTALALLAAFAAGSWAVRRSLRPLGRVREAAVQVAGLSLDRGSVQMPPRLAEDATNPDTEVGQVGLAVNRMLDHLETSLQAREASEQQLRRFVADASHELRTPLASIRGYAELTRRGQYDLHPDAVHALSRVEAESIRMGSLVEDLLLLARLDAEPVLQRSPQPLAPLLRTAVADAAAAGPDYEWACEIDPDAEQVQVAMDASRLQQVIVNLLGNVRAHTPAGTEAVLALTVIGGEAVVTVTDNGPGIDPGVLPHVFDRFVRGDASRSRSTGSTGLGLAIAAALVAAHQGEIRVASAPGRTVFTVVLPVAESSAAAEAATPAAGAASAAAR